MSANQIVISANAERPEALTVEFTRKEFSDFVFSLVSTPREERRVFLGGFDLSKDRIKSIIEKLNFQINRHNDLLNWSFVADVDFDSGYSLTVNDFGQFFGVEIRRPEEVKSVSITLTYVIGLSGSDGLQRSYEKQIVHISINAGEEARIEVAIRSTDVAWPSTIFPLFESEVAVLSREVYGSFSVYRPRFQKLILSLFSFRREYVVFFAFLPILGINLFASVRSIRNENSASYVYNSVTNGLTYIDPLDIVEKNGVAEAARILEQGQVLHNAGMQVDGQPVSDIVLNYLLDIPLLVWLVVVAILATVYFLGRQASLVRISMIGRIFLDQPVSPRPQVKLTDGLLPSVVLAVTTGFVATGMWELVKSINGL